MSFPPNRPCPVIFNKLKFHPFKMKKINQHAHHSRALSMFYQKSFGSKLIRPRFHRQNALNSPRSQEMARAVWMHFAILRLWISSDHHAPKNKVVVLFKKCRILQIRPGFDGNDQTYCVGTRKCPEIDVKPVGDDDTLISKIIKILQLHAGPAGHKKIW